jgi:type II secretory pathway pseudopilin PulG
MVVLAVIGILSAIVVPLYGSMQTRVRIAKAQADVRSIASAVSVYSAHMSALPSALSDLTTASTNSLGLSAGPFMRTVPAPPAGGGWSTYGYSATTTGLVTVTASGDNTTVVAP